MLCIKKKKQENKRTHSRPRHVVPNFFFFFHITPVNIGKRLVSYKTLAWHPQNE